MKQATFIQVGNVFQPAIADEHGMVTPLEIRSGRPAYYKTADAARGYAERILADAPEMRGTRPCSCWRRFSWRAAGFCILMAQA